jgi:hypothetical protein
LEWPKFVGRYGDDDGSPESPLLEHLPKEWTRFTSWHSPAGECGEPAWWDPCPQHFREADHLEGMYLGRFATCADGSGERIQFSLKAHTTNEAFAYVSAEAGSSVAFVAGDMFSLGYPVDGRYTFDEAEVTGSGRAEIWIVAGLWVEAAGLLVDVVSGCGGIAAAGNTSVPSGTETLALRVIPCPAQQECWIHVIRGQQTTTLWVSGADGRLVRELGIVGGVQGSQLRWDLTDTNGHRVPGGVYYIHGRGTGGARLETRVLVVR